MNPFFKRPASGCPWRQRLVSLRRLLTAPLLALAAVALLTGCTGYKVGPTNGQVAGENSIQVHPFLNKTMEPRLTEYVTSSLRKSLQQDGTYKLDTKGDGDIVVTGTIVEFDRSSLSFQPTDIRTVRDYYLSMRVEVTATERSTGKVLVARQVHGRTSIRVGADLASAERQAIPLLAEDLARNATSALVDGTW